MDNYQLDHTGINGYALRRKGFYATPCRIAILDILRAQTAVPETVLQQNLIALNFSAPTISRAIHSLLESDLISRVIVAHQSCFVATQQFSLHRISVTCRRCNKHRHMRSQRLAKVLRSYSESIGFSQIRSAITITGTCTSCQQNTYREPSS